VQVDRGGQVTYHGPGQLVVYPLLNIRRLGMGVRDLVNKLEQAIVDTLAEFDVTAYPKPDAPGVYVDGNKVASLGLRIRKGCSFHGLAINVDMDLEPFQRINPCGYAGLEMVQLKDLSAKKIDMTELKTLLMGHLQGLLGQETLEYPEGLPALLKSGL
jgi:lipoyl(octanoyl) transferase